MLQEVLVILFSIADDGVTRLATAVRIAGDWKNYFMKVINRCRRHLATWITPTSKTTSAPHLVSVVTSKHWRLEKIGVDAITKTTYGDRHLSFTSRTLTAVLARCEGAASAGTAPALAYRQLAAGSERYAPDRGNYVPTLVILRQTLRLEANPVKTVYRPAVLAGEYAIQRTVTHGPDKRNIRQACRRSQRQVLKQSGAAKPLPG